MEAVIEISSSLLLFFYRASFFSILLADTWLLIVENSDVIRDWLDWAAA